MAKPLLPNSTIQWALSASPNKLTDPQTHRKVWIPDQSFDFLEILQRRMHLIFYYKKHNDDDAAWHVAGWIKQALGDALIEQPILAGRLRESAHGGLEIVSNDSGVRCVAAQTPLSLIEFLESKDRHKVENELVHWHDNPAYEENFQYSPLFYIQVTNFQCGGYAIGISCSLLLADPLCLTTLLKKWADSHRCVAFHGDIPKTNEFYNPYLKQTKRSLPVITTPKNYKRNTSKFTLYMFIIDTNEKLYFGDEMYKYFVLLCIEEAETKAGQTMNSNFALVTKVPDGDIKVETSTKKGIIARDPKNMTYELRCTSLEDLGTTKISFQKENVPVDVSHWVACDSHEGTVLVVMASPQNGMTGMNVYVTFPIPSDKTES